MIFLLAVGIIALTALTVSNVVAVRAFLRRDALVAPLPDHYATADDLAGSVARVDALEALAGDHTLALNEGILRVDRAEKRVQKTVTSARKLLRESGIEHAGLEAEYEEIHDAHVVENVPEEVLALPARVDDPRPSGIPGLSRSALAQLRENANV